VVLLGGAGNDNRAVSARTPSVPAAPPGSGGSGPGARSSPSTRAGSTAAAPARNRAPTAHDLATAIVDYFDVVPGNLDEGWARLTPHFQRTKARNRHTYDHFWHRVERVDVRGVHGTPPRSASATLVYRYKDGRIVTEHTTFWLVRQDGVLKIDRES
jgi:hypothetical protein